MARAAPASAKPGPAKGLPRRGMGITLIAALMMLVVLQYLSLGGELAVVGGQGRQKFGCTTFGCASSIPAEVAAADGTRGSSSEDESPLQVASDRPALETARGWHWDARRMAREVTFDADSDETRLDHHPHRLPAVEDPGEIYLPFPEDKVEPRWRNTTRLVYDSSVIRLKDDFGLVDDMYSPEQLEEFFQLVVDIYARGNIYFRIAREDLHNVHQLSRKQSLEYLAYVEGPDLAEMTSIKNNNSHGFSEEIVAYNQWYYEEYRKVYGFPMLDAQVKHSGNLRKDFYTATKYEYLRNVIDWIIGYPHMLTPWDLYHTTPMYPIYVFHGMNGECRGGRITGRAGSCWLPPKEIVDKTTGKFVKTMSCRRFVGGVKARSGMSTDKAFMRNSEKRVMTGPGAARMWAHEIGHSLGQHHPASSCNSASKWEDNNLMLQQRHVGLKGVGCPKTPTEDQASGTAWNDKQLQRIRGFIKVRDIRPSRTLPNARTVGESTMQMGVSSELVFSRMKYNRATMIGSGKKVTRKPCSLPQATVIFSQLPSPIDGRVYRVRWLPSKWRAEAFTVIVSVVRPEANYINETNADFRIISQSTPLTVPLMRQQVHVELDLVDPLDISRGEFLAISSTDGSPLDIDQQLYVSDRVLYADISGRFPTTGPSMHHEMMSFLDFPTSYPKVLLSRHARDAFMSSGVPLDPHAESLRASAAPEDRAAWCLPLIFNYDVMRD